MTSESIPHISLTSTQSLSLILSREYKLLQRSNLKRLGSQLLDLTLLTLQKSDKCNVLINDAKILTAYLQRAQEVGLIASPESHSPIYLEWSPHLYPSQKTLMIGMSIPQLNDRIDGSTMLEILVDQTTPNVLPSTKSIVSSVLDTEILEKIKKCYQLYQPSIDYAMIDRLLSRDHIQLNVLKEEVKSIKLALDQILPVLYNVDMLTLDTATLRRQNHSSKISQIQELYDAYRHLQSTLDSITQISIPPLKKPLNAAMLVDYLRERVSHWVHISHLLTSESLLDWVQIIHSLPPDISDSLWRLACYKVLHPWDRVLIKQRAEQSLIGMEYHSSRIKADDCQHLLRVSIGNIEQRAALIHDPTLIDQATLTLVPNYLIDYVQNGIGYEVVSTASDLPVMSELHLDNKLNDMQLLSNSQCIADLLLDKCPGLEISISRSQIILSTLTSDNFELAEILSKHGFERLEHNDVRVSLKECLIDINREVHLITIGALLSIDDLSDWVYQTQLIEKLESTGIKVIDIPIDINRDGRLVYRQSLQSLLDRYVED